MHITVDTKAPDVSARHPDQRWFNGPDGRHCLHLEPKHRTHPHTSLSVCRSADEGFATVDIRLHFAGQVQAALSAAELRALAAMLLSAAVDLETVPASKLAIAA